MADRCRGGVNQSLFREWAALRINRAEYRYTRLRRQERVCNDLRGCPRRSAEGRSVLRLGDTAHPAFLMLDGGADKRGEEWMGLEWLGLELRGGLGGEGPGVFPAPDDLPVGFGRRACRVVEARP